MPFASKEERNAHYRKRYHRMKELGIKPRSKIAKSPYIFEKIENPFRDGDGNEIAGIPGSFLSFEKIGELMQMQHYKAVKAEE